MRVLVRLGRVQLIGASVRVRTEWPGPGRTEDGSASVGGEVWSHFVLLRTAGIHDTDTIFQMDSKATKTLTKNKKTPFFASEDWLFLFSVYRSFCPGRRCFSLTVC